ncbi:MAG: adenosylcobinamide amidohydrolase [Myxococcota bacterium]|nr:adenosylcobinamide amidohydrolase [Myxococcota bacterium]
MKELESVSLERREKMVIARLGRPHRVLSSAIHGGGLTSAQDIVWTHFHNTELPIGADPLALLTARLSDAGLTDAVAMMTSRDLAHVHTAAATSEGVCVEAVATVGLSNALRVGDPPGFAPLGTINLLVRISVPLTEAALVEAICIVTEARTAAVASASWPSRRTGAPATGTGTDCIVVAAPLAGTAQPWCGKHTAAGSALGQATLSVIGDGVRTWVAQRAERSRRRTNKPAHHGSS